MKPKYNQSYLSKIKLTIHKALTSHRRITAIRVDLRFPTYKDDEFPYQDDSGVITRFIESLKAQLKVDVPRRSLQWNRKLTCQLHYVWVREFGEINNKKHYHVILLLNKDLYHSVGHYQQENGTVYSMVQKAWYSAMKLPYRKSKPLAHFPDKCVAYFTDKDIDTLSANEWVIRQSNYLAKNHTKVIDDERSFGCSR
ncbi:inovirus Gp2 family protein [Providencia manganoxydans]|uniref:inovirus Gp2 family protein n=1 Tax=Providencia manganoxydans TaxID=2923283 RepID=UPI0029C0534A|nr:inovirus Gp2 family protein [Providencia manganoxydans]MDX4945477.1 inovirus Gp2 family protein [Providencia manganoxydans]